MRSSIATVCLSGDLAGKLSAIAKAGFMGVEIFENDLIGATQSPTEIASMIKDLGLICTCYQPFRDFEGLSGALRQRAFDRAEAKFDLMQTLGTDLMLVCSSISTAATGDTAKIIEDFSELGQRAGKRGLKVGYEALAWGRHVNDHRVAWDIVRQVNHPNIGIILDTFHSLARDIPISSIKEIDGDKIFLVQVADAPNVRMDYLFWSRHFRCFPGQGNFAISDYLAAVEAQGYKGPWSLEIFNDRFRAWSATQIAGDGKRALLAIQEDLSQKAQTPVAPYMPLRSAPRGVGFLEFSVSGVEANVLKALLGAMGFGCVGQHRTKAVTRWQQGEINMVINAEDKGFSAAHHHVHGPSICAMGVKVDDVEATMSRAKGLQMDVFTQAVAPGELQMASIRGVGGALVYFVSSDLDEAFWLTDFEPVTAPSQTAASLLKIDHIAQSMRTEEFLSWLLYYTSLLEVGVTAPVDIADPLGLVQSQAIESKDGAFRVTLNGAAGQTLSSRFVDEYFGAGVQHVAFSSADIFATAKCFADNQVEFLPIADNYYEDIAARFGLDKAMIDRLKALNILYDEDSEGAYLQLYTRAFEKRVFFEIVQRTGYGGYGAANAPFRLAAQARYKAGLD
jgi:4-hydroxyphenylpyruvate dioxygenase